jgi:Response regulators consisting of a CheY-like receiver domain and a winged-helix DNA-binding domain
MRILVLEDDSVQGEVLASLLKQAHHDVSLFTRGDDTIQALRSSSFDLALLDWQTPGASGREVLNWIHEQLLQPPPVIFISQRDDETSIVDALMAGADDYLAKPIRPAELLARIAVVERRQSMSSPETVQPVLRAGPLILDRFEHVATMDGKTIDLTQKEFELAWFLLRNLGRLISREQALQEVWGIEDVHGSRTLDTHVSRLRRKLKLVPEKGFRLISIYNYGYRLELVDSSEA